MEHQEAKTMHAAEKYVLGEMTDELRDQFEEHYFDCTECALDVKAVAAFIAASKEVFKEEPVTAPTSPDVSANLEAKRTWSWSAWLKPLIAIPAVAALVAMTVYEGHKLRTRVPDAVVTSSQNLVTSADFGLRGGDRVQSESTVVRMRQGDTIGLHFDFTPSQTFNAYLGEVQDGAGRVLLRISIPAERINKEVRFVVPAGRLHTGNYVLQVYGDEAARSAVAKYAFSIEIIP
jgi:anti-sigma factor RsiW